MKGVWVYKLDGTVQCSSGPGISLEDMQRDLEAIGGKVIKATKATSCLFFSSVCGAPTGRVNAYLITEASAQVVFNGIVGPNGFRRWDCPEPPEGGEADDVAEDAACGVPLPYAQGTSVLATPTLCRELIGRVARVYHQGDALTEDFRPDRVNIELDPGNRIADIWFG